LAGIAAGKLFGVLTPVFFAMVNQVLVRLWTRMSAFCLTGKCCSWG
jgi:hypothetical protein